MPVTAEEQPPLYVWKFVVSRDRWIQDPDDEALSYKGYLAVAIAATRSEAEANVRRYANQFGRSHTWLKVATVTKHDIASGVLAWAQV